MRVLIPFLFLLPCAMAQPAPHNRLTFSGGWSRQVGGVSWDQQSATGFGLSYGYRLQRNVEAETGLLTALNPTGTICSGFGCVDINDRYFWVPFGLRFIVPVARGRVELSAGGGGLYEQYTVGTPFPGGGPDARHGWGGYFVGSAAVALDRGHHFWLCATPRWFLANPAYTRDRWFQVSGEFSVRFR